MFHEWGDESGVLPRSNESHKSWKATPEKYAHVKKKRRAEGLRKECGRRCGRNRTFIEGGSKRMYWRFRPESLYWRSPPLLSPSPLRQGSHRGSHAVTGACSFEPRAAQARLEFFRALGGIKCGSLTIKWSGRKCGRTAEERFCILGFGGPLAHA